MSKSTIKKVKEKEREKFALEPVDNSCPKGNHWIVIKVQEIDAVTRAGIIIPSSAKLNSEAAEVISVAPACTCGLVVGDIVLDPTTSGYPVTIAGKQYKIVAERDITCRYDPLKVKIKDDEAERMNPPATGHLRKT